MILATPSFKVYQIYFNDGSMYESIAGSYRRACELACYYSKMELADITRVNLPSGKKEEKPDAKTM